MNFSKISNLTKTFIFYILAILCLFLLGGPYQYSFFAERNANTLVIISLLSVVLGTAFSYMAVRSENVKWKKYLALIFAILGTICILAYIFARITGFDL